MVVRINLTLEQKEYSALLKLALKEMRNPEGQIRYLLCQELKELGLLPKDKEQDVIDEKIESTKKGATC